LRAGASCEAESYGCECDESDNAHGMKCHPFLCWLRWPQLVEARVWGDNYILRFFKMRQNDKTARITPDTTMFRFDKPLRELDFHAMQLQRARSRCIASCMAARFSPESISRGCNARKTAQVNDCELIGASFGAVAGALLNERGTHATHTFHTHRIGPQAGPAALHHDRCSRLGDSPRPAFSGDACAEPETSRNCVWIQFGLRPEHCFRSLAGRAPALVLLHRFGTDIPISRAELVALAAKSAHKQAHCSAPSDEIR
jgi:hypothetical protein